jgi:hypothetical protein
MQNIRLNHQVFYGPGKWDELDAEGLLQLAAVTSLDKFKSMMPYYLVMKLFKVPVRLFRKLRQSQMIQLESCLDWMSEKNNLTKWLIDPVTISRQIYYGPKNRLANLTVEEFMYAEAAYAKWLTTQKLDPLYTLFATLYRKRSFWFKKRLLFTDTHKEKAEAGALSLRPHVLKAIAINYAGCRNFIIEKHPNVWKPVVQDDKPLTKAQAPQKVDWVGLALQQSGDKFGTYDQTIKVNLWLFLADMDKKVKEAHKTVKP